MVDFTVVICTYNGGKRVSQVLEKLRSQVGTEEISWEILVIDNNSTDNTAEVIQQHISDWQEIYPLKYYLEPRQGLAFARRCGVREAKSDLIGFLDDDNLPYPNWLAEAYKFGQLHTRAGAYGGQIHGKFEVEPPPGFERIARFFAILEGKKTYCYNERYKNTRQKLFPPGAGVVIRKQAWIENVPEVPIITDFMALRGEDIEMCSHIWKGGWEIWFNSEMSIDHLIPKSRFEKEYLMRLFRENGLSRHSIRMLAYQPWQRPFMAFLYMINDIKKMISFYIKNKSRLQTDVVTSSEMELLLNICISPFYHLKKR